MSNCNQLSVKIGRPKLDKTLLPVYSLLICILHAYFVVQLARQYTQFSIKLTQPFVCLALIFLSAILLVSTFLIGCLRVGCHDNRSNSQSAGKRAPHVRAALSLLSIVVQSGPPCVPLMHLTTALLQIASYIMLSGAQTRHNFTASTQTYYDPVLSLLRSFNTSPAFTAGNWNSASQHICTEQVDTFTMSIMCALMVLSVTYSCDIFHWHAALGVAFSLLCWTAHASLVVAFSMCMRLLQKKYRHQFSPDTSQPTGVVFVVIGTSALFMMLSLIALKCLVVNLQHHQHPWPAKQQVQVIYQQRHKDSRNCAVIKKRLVAISAFVLIGFCLTASILLHKAAASLDEQLSQQQQQQQNERKNGSESSRPLQREEINSPDFGSLLLRLYVSLSCVFFTIYGLLLIVLICGDAHIRLSSSLERRPAVTVSACLLRNLWTAGRVGTSGENLTVITESDIFSITDRSLKKRLLSLLDAEPSIYRVHWAEQSKCEDSSKTLCLQDSKCTPSETSSSLKTSTRSSRASSSSVLYCDRLSLHRGQGARQDTSSTPLRCVLPLEKPVQNVPRAPNQTSGAGDVGIKEVQSENYSSVYDHVMPRCQNSLYEGRPFPEGKIPSPALSCPRDITSSELRPPDWRANSLDSSGADLLGSTNHVPAFVTSSPTQALIGATVCDATVISQSVIKDQQDNRATCQGCDLAEKHEKIIEIQNIDNLPPPPDFMLS